MVQRILELMTEKYAKTLCEKILENMKWICGFRTDNKVDVLIDDFEEMVTETRTLRLNERLEYALSSQFIDRLEKGGKINAGERLRLKDILEDADGNPKPGNTMEAMKKELKKLKVAENREEPFAKETKTFYTKNEENRSRYDRYENWKNNLKSNGYKRSESNPRFFKTAYKGRWIRADSKFGGRSRSRPNSRFRNESQQRFRNESQQRNKFRNISKSTERPKSDLSKNVEQNEKKIDDLTKTLDTRLKTLEEMI